MEPVVLRAGRLQAEFEEGGLRYIAFNGVEIVRGIYAAVRDRDWGTVTPRIRNVRIREDACGVTVHFGCEHAENDIDFFWNGEIRLEDAKVRFNFDGYARTGFDKNRIGFCVLHPVTFAGLAATIHTPSGPVYGEFPTAISPHQPFRNMLGMQFEPVPGIRAELSFEGDTFETEDQRNWTDASFKTYCTPLAHRFPVRIEAGQTIKQAVELRIHGGLEAAFAAEKECCIRLEAGGAKSGKLPELGFAVPVSEEQPSESDREWLSQLNPSFLRLTLDLRDSGWSRGLDSAALWAGRYGCGIELELLLDTYERLRELIGLIGQKRLPIMRIIPYAAGAFIAGRDEILEVKRALQNIAADMEIEVGGGTRAYYAELNRAVLPLDVMDFAAYSMNPQLHAFDDRSLMETVPIQRDTAADAAAKTRRPLCIGPVALKPRLNPNAAGGAEGRIPVSGQTDARQERLFGAVWTLGSIASLSGEGADPIRSVSYYELWGPLGLVHRGIKRPLFHVFADIAAVPSASVIPLSGRCSQLAALALDGSGGWLRLLLANMTDAWQEAELTVGTYRSAAIRMLDGTSRAASSAGEDEAPAERPAGADSEPIRIRLAPYAYACLDIHGWRLEGASS